MKHPKIGIIIRQQQISPCLARRSVLSSGQIGFAVHYIRELYVQLVEVYSGLNSMLLHLYYDLNFITPKPHGAVVEAGPKFNRNWQ